MCTYMRMCFTGCAGKEDSCPRLDGKIEHVLGPAETRLEYVDRTRLKVVRAGRAGEVVYLLHIVDLGESFSHVAAGLAPVSSSVL